MNNLSSVISSLCSAASEINVKLRNYHIDEKTHRRNASGDFVSSMDEFAEHAILKTFKDRMSCLAIASEDRDEPETINVNSRFLLAIDPLDGSKGVNSNVPTGTIFSIYQNDEKGFLQPASGQLAAGFFLYGPSTLLIYTEKNSPTKVFVEKRRGNYVSCDFAPAKAGNIVSVNSCNRRLWPTTTRQWYDDATNEGRASLRYSGSLVADAYRVLVEGGIFAYPSDDTNPRGKLRSLFEVYPMAMIFENSGNTAIDEFGNKITNMNPSEIHEKSTLIMGCTSNVETFKKYIK